MNAAELSLSNEYVCVLAVEQWSWQLPRGRSDFFLQRANVVDQWTFEYWLDSVKHIFEINMKLFR